MTPRELLEAAERLPTIASLDDELSLIRDVQRLNPVAIETDMDSFISLIEIIQRSHADNGIFEMGEAEEGRVVDFFRWLRSLEAKLGVPLTRHADGLDLTCADLAKMMPEA